MKSPLAIGSLAALGLLLQTASAVDQGARVNGWYPCTYSTFHVDAANTTATMEFECSEIEVPLCYDGVCRSDRNINVFVKRRLGTAASKDGVPRKAGILIEGGPGGTSVGMENVIFNLIDTKDDTVDYYTFDHRGTGRSEFVQCDAASALTPGSPDGTAPSPDELRTCLADLSFQYDGQAAAFSTTSAAMDVRMIIDTFLTNHHVYPYGMSYGTYLTQRLLQLKIPQIKGYVFDGVDVLTTKDDPIEGANSHWNKAMAGPTRRLLEFCFDDPKCPIKLQSRDKVLEEVIGMLDKLDDGQNECGQLVADSMGLESPSVATRYQFYNDVEKYGKRALGLDTLGAVLRCSPEDVVNLKKVLGGEEPLSTDGSDEQETPVPTTPKPLDPLVDISQLLYDIVVYSERWGQPTPLQEKRTKFIHDTAAAANQELTPGYCLFTGSTEPACTEIKDQLPPSNTTFYYKRDKYYNEPITLPDGISALVLNGGLDFATPKEFGELLYSKLKGSGKGVMVVNFDYGVHCDGEAVAESTETPCHDGIIRQFIVSDGEIDKIDTSCMEKLPETVFHGNGLAADKAQEEEEDE